MLVLTFALGYIFIRMKLPESDNRVIFEIPLLHFQVKPVHLLYFLIAIVCFLALIIVTSLVSINKVQIDITTDTIIFTSLFTKQTVAVDEIKGYFDTVHKNQFKVFYGLLLELRGNKTIQVTGQNVGSLSAFKDYLDKRNISCSGQRKMKFPFN
jgi:hypothetical protein